MTGLQHLQLVLLPVRIVKYFSYFNLYTADSLLTSISFLIFYFILFIVIFFSFMQEKTIRRDDLEKSTRFYFIIPFFQFV